MGWALITHPDHMALVDTGMAIAPRPIQERDLPWALGQGWIVIGRDADVSAPEAECNLQSNPHRIRRFDRGTER